MIVYTLSLHNPDNLYCWHAIDTALEKLGCEAARLAPTTYRTNQGLYGQLIACIELDSSQTTSRLQARPVENDMRSPSMHCKNNLIQLLKSVATSKVCPCTGLFRLC